MKPEDLPDGPVIVDTNVFSWAFLRAGKYADFKPFLDQALRNSQPLLLTFSIVGELRAWTANPGWDAVRIAKLELAIQGYVVLPFDEEVTRQYGPLHAKLGDQLKKFGRNDMWTAACSLSHSELPTILTDDIADFQKIQAVAPNLRLAHPEL